MKVKVPTTLEDITLEQVQSITESEDLTIQADTFLIEYSKVDPLLFDDETKLAIWQTAIKMLSENELSKPKEVIGKYRLPTKTLSIKVGHLIELVNIALDGYNGLELIAGCIYRKDWSLPYSESEIIETAHHFRTLPIIHSVHAQLFYQDIITDLKEIYPILYEGKQEEEQDTGRKMYDLLLSLSNQDFTKWSAVRNEIVSDAFLFLETKKIEYDKQKERNNQ